VAGRHVPPNPVPRPATRRSGGRVQKEGSAAIRNTAVPRNTTKTADKAVDGPRLWIQAGAAPGRRSSSVLRTEDHDRALCSARAGRRRSPPLAAPAEQPQRLPEPPGNSKAQPFTAWGRRWRAECCVIEVTALGRRRPGRNTRRGSSLPLSARFCFVSGDDAPLQPAAASCCQRRGYILACEPARPRTTAVSPCSGLTAASASPFVG